MDKRIRLTISTFFLIAPAIAIYLGHYHPLLALAILIGFIIYTLGEEFYLGKIRDSHLYKIKTFAAVFMGVFGYRALKEVLDLETNLRSLFGYTPFIVTFIVFVIVSCLFELKYNVKGRRTLVSEK